MMKFSYFRVPLIINQALRIKFGFAFKMTFLLWCVCGGLLLHMFESTFFSMLIKPVYETPINTAQDVLDRGLPVIYIPGAESLVEILKNSPFSITKLAIKLLNNSGPDKDDIIRRILLYQLALFSY